MTTRDRIIAVVLVVGFAVGLYVLGRGIINLDQDDQLINRGQNVNSCIGDRQDEIDRWRGIATAEFVIQSDRGIDQGLPVQTGLALRAEVAIFLLVDSKQEIRADQAELIESGETDFTCPPIADPLIAPDIQDLFTPGQLEQLPDDLKEELGL